MGMFEMSFTCGLAMFTILFNSVFVGALTTRMMTLQKIAEERSKGARALRTLSSDHELTTAFSFAAKVFIRSQQILNDSEANEKLVLTFLPKQLRRELLFELRQETIAKHRFFRMFGHEFPAAMRHLCADVIGTVNAAATELVFERGDRCGEMLFVAKGELGYYLSSYDVKEQQIDGLNNNYCESIGVGDILAAMFDFRGVNTPEMSQSPSVSLQGEQQELPVRCGSWICEPTIWVEWRCQGTLVAKFGSVLLKLEAGAFAGMLERHSNAWARAAVYGWRYANILISHLQAQEMSDLYKFRVSTPTHEEARLFPTLNGVSLRNHRLTLPAKGQQRMSEISETHEQNATTA